jgi:hypothetical protein
MLACVGNVEITAAIGIYKMSIGIHFVPEAKLLSHLLLWVVNL